MKGCQYVVERGRIARQTLGMEGLMKRLTMLIVLAVFSLGCSGGKLPDPPTPQALQYQTTSIKRSGLDLYVSIVAPEANTFEQRAQTAIRAALDFHGNVPEAEYFRVMLGPSKLLIERGYALAMAEYSPGGKGKGGSGNWTWRNTWGSKTSLTPEILLSIERYEQLSIDNPGLDDAEKHRFFQRKHGELLEPWLYASKIIKGQDNYPTPN